MPWRQSADRLPLLQARVSAHLSMAGTFQPSGPFGLLHLLYAAMLGGLVGCVISAWWGTTAPLTGWVPSGRAGEASTSIAAARSWPTGLR